MKIGRSSFETQGRPEEPAERNEPLPPRAVVYLAAKREAETQRHAPPMYALLGAFYSLPWNNPLLTARRPVGTLQLDFSPETIVFIFIRSPG